MILYRHENYQNSDELILTVQNDEAWQNYQMKLEEIYARMGLDGCAEQRELAIHGIGKGEFYQHWEYTMHDIKKTLYPFWEEMIYSMTTLVALIRNMLTINWFEQKEMMERSQQPEPRVVNKDAEETIFIDQINTALVRDKIEELWTKTSVDFKPGAAVQGELLKLQNEWICFYKVFLELEWLKDTRRSAFVSQMHQWFGTKKKDRLLPCHEESLKRLDSYVKKTPAKVWDVNANSYRGQIKKLKELIFIYKYLLKKFQNGNFYYTNSPY